VNYKGDAPKGASRTAYGTLPPRRHPGDRSAVEGEPAGLRGQMVSDEAGVTRSPPRSSGPGA